MTPDRMVISEAMRTFTYLNLYGYLTDAVVVNRVFPDEVDGYFGAWREVQREQLELVESGFAPVPILRAPYFEREVAGRRDARPPGGGAVRRRRPGRGDARPPRAGAPARRRQRRAAAGPAVRGEGRRVAEEDRARARGPGRRRTSARSCCRGRWPASGRARRRWPTARWWWASAPPRRRPSVPDARDAVREAERLVREATERAEAIVREGAARVPPRGFDAPGGGDGQPFPDLSALTGLLELARGAAAARAPAPARPGAARAADRAARRARLLDRAAGGRDARAHAGGGHPDRVTDSGP